MLAGLKYVRLETSAYFRALCAVAQLHSSRDLKTRFHGYNFGPGPDGTDEDGQDVEFAEQAKQGEAAIMETPEDEDTLAKIGAVHNNGKRSKNRVGPSNWLAVDRPSRMWRRGVKV